MLPSAPLYHFLFHCCFKNKTYIPDKYVELRNEEASSTVDPRMLDIVERVFERCYTDGGKGDHALNISVIAI